MKIYVDELPITCFQCPLVIQYDGNNAECVLFKNEWKRLIREYDSNEKLVSCKLADCPLEVISEKDIMSNSSIKEDLGITDDEYNDADLLSEEEFENLFKDLQRGDDEFILNHCDANCESCPLIKRCEDKKRRGIMTPAEIARLVTGV